MAGKKKRRREKKISPRESDRVWGNTDFPQSTLG